MHTRKIGKYQIIGRVGNVGPGQIYKALHPGLNRVVAVEVLNRSSIPHRGVWEQFQQQKQKMAALRHPNILQIHDLEVLDDAVLVVTEHVEGETLAQRLARLRREKRQTSLRRALRIILTVARAVHHIHEQGIQTCAIQPAHVMLRDDGQVILTDIGSRNAHNAATDAAAYRAPEQASGAEPSRQSDVYALGVMLYQLSTGQLPFEAEAPFPRISRRPDTAPPMPRRLRDDISPELEQVMLRALAPDPQARYQSAQEFVTDLSDVWEQMKGQSKPKSTTAAPRKPPPTRRLRWFGVGVVVGLILAAGIFVGRPRNTSTPAPTPNAAGTALAAHLVDLEATLSFTPPPSHTPTATATPIPSIDERDTLTLTPTSTTTHTPAPSPSPSPSPTTCVYSMALVQDTNYNSAGWGNVVNTFIQKTWLVRNDGNCPWPTGIALAPLDGESFGMSAPIEVDALIPDWDAEISVALRVPVTPGYFEGRFQLQTPDGQPIGEPLEVKLQARPPTTAVATATPPLTPTLAVPLHIVGWQLTEWQDDVAHNTWTAKLELWAEGGDGQYAWYRDTLDNPLSGNVLEFQWRRCANFFGSVWVTSAGGSDHENLFIAYPGSCE